MRWLILAAILLFIAAQVSRMRPSKRDQQLQALRQVATRAGLTVRFWTARNSGYRLRQLPESGYQYLLPRRLQGDAEPVWALWLDSDGRITPLGGQPPELAYQWLEAFHGRFHEPWALLESCQAGLGLVWQERGTPEDVTNICEALQLLRQNLDALPG